MLYRREILNALRARAVGSIEELALRSLALRGEWRDCSQLFESQLPCGGWPNALGTSEPNAYSTSMALIALAHLRDRRDARAAVNLAFGWLDETAGREGHWLWRWKFRWFDRRVKFDTSKYGWPWIDGTVSWVAPTALAVIAHRVWKRPSPRVERGMSMLLDRACSSGGWNAGNSEAFGVSLTAHPDFTAMGLIALRSCGVHAHPAVRSAEDYLSSRLAASEATYSLAWALLALRNNPKMVSTLRARLLKSVKLDAGAKPTISLALAALALEDPPLDLTETPQ
ncbi:MAG: hypothetical protein LC130_23915 [Bryobacterales bacterium]|nr:hypothetical protein [Bryobacterales bacterium]